MPELPEVETTRRGIARRLLGRRVVAVVVRKRDQRWPIPRALGTKLRRQRIIAVRRRGKYLLIDTKAGSALVHLGMSGSLAVMDAALAPRKHDHWDMVFDDGRALRMHDPRRFGALLWIAAGADEARHPLLRHLGPEPLALRADALAAHLAARARGRRGAVKQFVMDGKVVVGVGNIYASEALFAARVRPGRAAGRVTKTEWRAIARAIQRVLARAIAKGGTTLKDFSRPDGAPGYFRTRLNVYGRGGEPCRRCGATIKARVQGQRATYWCGQCQR